MRIHQKIVFSQGQTTESYFGLLKFMIQFFSKSSSKY